MNKIIAMMDAISGARARKTSLIYNRSIQTEIHLNSGSSGGKEDKKYKTWGDFYKGPSSILHILRDIILHLRYLCAIILVRPRRILEIGTGTGIQSIFLSYFIKNLTALDNDRNVIRNSAQANIKHFRRKIDLLLIDAFSLPFKDKSFDICYSQGFLEHFRNDEVVRLINEQLRVSRLIIHSIPSDKYPMRQFGNERHLSPVVWYDILANCQKHNKVDVKYGYFPLINWYIMIRVTA